MSLTCACGTPFSVDHVMSCHKGGLPTLQQNEIRDLAEELLREVCHNVSVEPGLQALDGEHIRPRTANREDEARLDIRANGFWGRGQEAFFDVKVFHPNVPPTATETWQLCTRCMKDQEERVWRKSEGS